MRVAVLTHTYPRFPGDSNAPFVEHLMEHIGREGSEVFVLTPYDPAWNRSPADHTIQLATYRYIWPPRCHILGYSRTIEGNVRFRARVLALSPFLFLFGFRAFMNLVRQWKPDILHAHWILPNGYIAAMVSRATGIPLIIQLHGSDVFTAEKNPLFKKMASFAGKQARFIISPSPDLTMRLGKIGVDTGKIGLVPNTVEADFTRHITPGEKDALKKRHGIPDDHLVIFAMGRMVHVKGFEYLIHAFQKVARNYPRVTLVLAGDGILYPDMVKLRDSLGLTSQIIMPGAIGYHEVPLYFTMADMFVIPSVRHESGAVDGLPVVVPEAMSAGLPIIASDIGGIPVLVRNEFNGILVRERDVDGIMSAILRFVRDPLLMKTFGERSQRIVTEHVNYHTVATYITQLYHEIVLNKTMSEKISPFITGLE